MFAHSIRPRSALSSTRVLRVRLLSGRPPKPLQTPIAIIGGGPTGLLLSTLLSSYKVPSILLEGQSVEERCRHPQAHFINTRSMEILRQLPRLYRRLHDQMTPVEQWKHFQFGFNMLPETCLARVNHPVDRPLQANQDANGKLVSDGKPVEDGSLYSGPLSACSVGHLAQHTFCKILYDTAIEEAHPDTQLHYSTTMTSLKSTAGGGFEIHTNADLTIQSPVCVAADGAHSSCRKEWDMRQVGQVGIQHLLNIHVKTCPEWAKSHLHDQGRNYAMLYSTFHPNVVAMIVCHSIGEYVFQVPFFPPYQSFEDYSPDRVRQMVYDAMGIDANDPVCREQAQIDVRSVKPWTMSSLITDRYYHTTSNGGLGFLVGDAAHVFPPAGGLGMNTGMQDVHSLAWRLAWAFHKGHLSPENVDAGKTRSVMEAIGTTYEAERRPVAQANAALSVRNYNRILEITKAFYMNDQHPTLLIRVLDASSILMPFEVRREVFQRLYCTATWTLSSLRAPDHPYTKHLRQNLRRILARGGGLPLLFPKAEIGFGYDHSKQDDYDTPREEDPMGFTPRIREGYLFPHVEARVVTPEREEDVKAFLPNLKWMEPDLTSPRKAQSISLSDLPSQVSRDSKPCFVLLRLSRKTDMLSGDVIPGLKEAAARLSEKIEMNVQLVQVFPWSSTPLQANVADGSDIFLQEVAPDEDQSLLATYGVSLWLIRPDGHVVGSAEIHQSRGKASVAALELDTNLHQMAQRALVGRTILI